MRLSLMRVMSVLVVGCVTSPCLATVISIANPGFDANGPGVHSAIVGWTVSAAGSENYYKIAAHSAPDWGFLNRPGWMQQQLMIDGSPLHANVGDTISISVFQGLRTDSVVNQDFRIQLWSNASGTGAPVAEEQFGAAPVGGWVERVMNYTVATAGAGTDLYLRLFNAGGAAYAQVAVDDVSGTYTAATTTPEPSAMVLLTVGLTGLLAYAWRSRK